MKKRLVALVMTLCVAAALVVPAGAANSGSAEDLRYDITNRQEVKDNTTASFDYASAYKWAEEVGFPDDFLKNISEESLQRVYYDNASADNLVIGYDTDNILMGDNQPSVRAGNIGSNNMELRSFSVKHKNANGKITKVIIYFTAYWKPGKPAYRATDAIITNWDSTQWYFQDHSFWGRVEKVPNTSPDNTATTVYSDSVPAKCLQGGLGWYAPLSYITQAYTPVIRIGYELRPRNSNMPDGTTYTSSVTATYGHKSIGIQSISISGSGASVTMSGQDYEMGAVCNIKHG